MPYSVSYGRPTNSEIRYHSKCDILCSLSHMPLLSDIDCRHSWGFLPAQLCASLHGTTHYCCSLPVLRASRPTSQNLRRIFDVCCRMLFGLKPPSQCSSMLCGHVENLIQQILFDFGDVSRPLNNRTNTVPSDSCCMGIGLRWSCVLQHHMGCLLCL